MEGRKEEMAGRGNERLAMIGRRDTQTKNSPNSGNSRSVALWLANYPVSRSFHKGLGSCNFDSANTIHYRSTLDCILPCYTFLQSTTLCYVLCLYRGITAGPCSLPVG